MRRVHLIFGILVLIAFAVTGRYMRIDFPDKAAISAELRILMRSRHIYILLSAVSHIILGAYFKPANQTARRVVQWLGSTTLIASSVLFIVAFAEESYVFGTFSELSRNAIYLMAAGGLLHLFSVAGAKRDMTM